MKKEVSTVCFDEELRIEAYRFEGIKQDFPNHFHDHYLIGLIEDGDRWMSCRNEEYLVRKGNMVLLNPELNHSCARAGERGMDFRGLNISKQVMRELTKEIIGREGLPGFSEQVIYDEELNDYFRNLHRMVMEGSKEFEKEELLLFLVEALLRKYGQSMEEILPEYREEIERACDFMKAHYGERISLEAICQCAGLSKATLLRAFTKSMGITPYRYLETVRINEAKKLLEQGKSPVDVALQTGFSDQSHFTNYFRMFIGISPGAYRAIFLGQEQEEKGDA